MQLILNGDGRPVLFFLTSSTDHISGLTGAAPTVTISKSGAAFAAPAGAVAEVGNGWYALTPSGADVTTNGVLLLHATASGADPCDLKSQVVAFSPYAADVTVGGYATGQDPATLLLATPANKLATDTSGNVTVDTTDQGTIVTAVAAAILATPAQKLVTDSSGHVSVGTNADKTGYSLEQTFPTDFALLSINGSGYVTATNGGGGGGGPTVQQIVDGVWDELASGHVTAGTFGAILGTLSTLAIDDNGAVAINNFATGLLDVANGVETGLTVRQALRVIAASEVGLVSGAGTTEVEIYAAGQPETLRIAGTVDTTGNRTAVTLTP